LDVSVIIVNYNTRSVTRHCIESIFAYTTGIEFEVILVDNGSHDGSFEEFTQLDFGPSLILVKRLQNLGFGYANRIGVEYASGKYLFFLNSDTYLKNNAIKNIYDYMEKEQGIGVAGGYLEKPDGNYSRSFGSFPSTRSLVKYCLASTAISLSIITKHFDTISFRRTRVVCSKISESEVDYVSGADMMVRTSDYWTAGGFDPCYFMFFEEVQLQKNLSSHGFRNVVINGPRIVHLEGASVNKSPRYIKMYSFREYLFDRSAILYARKNFGVSLALFLGVVFYFKYMNPCFLLHNIGRIRPTSLVALSLRDSK